MGPRHEELVARIQKYPELQPSAKKVIELAEGYLAQDPPIDEDTLDKISEEFCTGTHFATRKDLNGQDPRFIVNVS
ncbi:MAG: hypothetical protein V4507_14260, partial [Verrucomicrobiota bacterium]